MSTYSQFGHCNTVLPSFNEQIVLSTKIAFEQLIESHLGFLVQFLIPFFLWHVQCILDCNCTYSYFILSKSCDQLQSWNVPIPRLHHIQMKVRNCSEIKNIYMTCCNLSNCGNPGFLCVYDGRGSLPQASWITVLSKLQPKGMNQ